MKYKGVVIQRLEQLENQLKNLIGAIRIGDREQFHTYEEKISENLEQIKTLVNQNHDETA